ncbi:putative ribonuclease H-like domain-containing protein [Tanacetum coccineum]
MVTEEQENIVPTRGLACLIAKATVDESNKWHRRLGHVNFKNLNKLVKGNLVRGLPSKIFQNDHTCVACQKGKQHKASCFSWVFLVRTNDENIGLLRDFIETYENQLNQKIKTIRCDNGAEFKNKDIIEFCGSKGIKREHSNAKTPQQNGIAERKNNTLIEAARTMLADSFLPNTFWAEAHVTAENKANKPAGPKEANHSAGTQDNTAAGNSEMEAEPAQEYYVLPIWSSYTLTVKSSEAKNGEELERLKRQEKETNDAVEALRKEFSQSIEDLLHQTGAARSTSTNTVNIVSTPVSTASPSRDFSTGEPYADQDDSQIPALEDIYDNPSNGIFTNASYDDEGAVADFTNLETTVNGTCV